jgi:hypothetical protein
MLLLVKGLVKVLLRVNQVIRYFLVRPLVTTLVRTIVRVVRTLPRVVRRLTIVTLAWAIVVTTHTTISARRLFVSVVRTLPRVLPRTLIPIRAVWDNCVRV